MQMDLTGAACRSSLERHGEGMSTVNEIETAVEKLTPAELREFAAWFEERQALLNSSDALFRMYDTEEEQAS